MKDQNNENLYSDIQDMSQIEDMCPEPRTCSMCPFVFMVQMMGMNPDKNIVEETSLYLNPLLED